MTSVLFLGDGTGWTAIDQQPSFGLSIQSASDDLSLIVSTRDCTNGSSLYVPRVLRDDGTLLFEDASCTDGQPVASIAPLPPDGSYFVVGTNNGSSTLHRTDGQSLTLGAGVIDYAFPTSMILGGAPQDSWIDTDGQPIDVPGWSQSMDVSPWFIGGDLHKVSGDGVYRVDDRAMVRITDRPAGVDPSTIVDVRGHLVVMRSNPESGDADIVRVVDGQGAVVATYTPAPSRSSPPDPTQAPIVSLTVAAASMSDNDAWYVLGTSYGTAQPGGEVPLAYEGAEDLWLFANRAGTPLSKRIELRRSALGPDTNDVSFFSQRTYVTSSTGAYLLFTDSGALHAVEVDSGSDRTLATDFQMASVSTIVRHHGPLTR